MKNQYNINYVRMLMLFPEGVFVDVVKTDSDEPHEVVRTIYIV